VQYTCRSLKISTQMYVLKMKWNTKRLT